MLVLFRLATWLGGRVILLPHGLAMRLVMPWGQTRDGGGTEIPFASCHGVDAEMLG